MSRVPLTEKKRREKRLRSSSFLKSLGVERTTAFMVIAVSVLLLVFFSILGLDSPEATSVESSATDDAMAAPDSNDLPVLSDKPLEPYPGS